MVRCSIEIMYEKKHIKKGLVLKPLPTFMFLLFEQTLALLIIFHKLVNYSKHNN